MIPGLLLWNLRPSLADTQAPFPALRQGYPNPFPYRFPSPYIALKSHSVPLCDINQHELLSVGQFPEPQTMYIHPEQLSFLKSIFFLTQCPRIIAILPLYSTDAADGSTKTIYT